MRRIKPHFFPLSQRSRFIAHVPLPENQQHQSQFNILTPVFDLHPRRGPKIQPVVSALRRSLKE
jgi:hypothetical protein